MSAASGPESPRDDRCKRKKRFSGGSLGPDQSTACREREDRSIVPVSRGAVSNP